MDALRHTQPANLGRPGAQLRAYLLPEGGARRFGCTRRSDANSETSMTHETDTAGRDRHAWPLVGGHRLVSARAHQPAASGGDGAATRRDVAGAARGHAQDAGGEGPTRRVEGQSGRVPVLAGQEAQARTALIDQEIAHLQQRDAMRPPRAPPPLSSMRSGVEAVQDLAAARREATELDLESQRGQSGVEADSRVAVGRQTATPGVSRAPSPVAVVWRWRKWRRFGSSTLSRRQALVG